MPLAPVVGLLGAVPVRVCRLSCHSLYGNCGTSVEYCGEGCQSGPCIGVPDSATGAGPPTYPKTEPTAPPPLFRVEGPPVGPAAAPPPGENSPTFGEGGLGPAPLALVEGALPPPPFVQLLLSEAVQPRQVLQVRR